MRTGLIAFTTATAAANIPPGTNSRFLLEISHASVDAADFTSKPFGISLTKFEKDSRASKGKRWVMGKFKQDPTDPVASAKGWSRRQGTARHMQALEKKNADLRARVEELEEENEKLRNIEIIQEGSHTRICIGGSEALPITLHKSPADDFSIDTGVSDE